MINLTNKEYEKQRRKGIKTNEGYIYINPKDKKKIIKVIEPDLYVPEYIDIKKHTIELLLNNKDYLNKLKIAIPEEGVSIEGIQRGYSTKYIKGTILSCILENNSIPIDTRIDCLKQIGSLLRNMENIRNTYSHLSNLYYNDIHENNFMVTNNFEVYGVDFDSCSIGDNIPTQGLYPMVLNRIWKSNNKYQKCNQLCEHSIDMIPNKNLELYCYTIIILNFMYGNNFYRWTSSKLDKYLNFLESHNANLELLYTLSYIFDEKVDNINPDYLLDYIKEIYQYSNIRYDELGTLRKTLR